MGHSSFFFLCYSDDFTVVNDTKGRYFTDFFSEEAQSIYIVFLYQKLGFAAIDRWNPHGKLKMDEKNSHPLTRPEQRSKIDDENPRVR